MSWLSLDLNPAAFIAANSNFPKHHYCLDQTQVVSIFFVRIYFREESTWMPCSFVVNRERSKPKTQVKCETLQQVEYSMSRKRTPALVQVCTGRTVSSECVTLFCIRASKAEPTSLAPGVLLLPPGFVWRNYCQKKLLEIYRQDKGSPDLHEEIVTLSSFCSFLQQAIT